MLQRRFSPLLSVKQMTYVQFNRIATKGRRTLSKNYEAILLDSSRFDLLTEDSVYFKVLLYWNQEWNAEFFQLEKNVELR